jgi:hypothetical protein
MAATLVVGAMRSVGNAVRGRMADRCASKVFRWMRKLRVLRITGLHRWLDIRVRRVVARRSTVVVMVLMLVPHRAALPGSDPLEPKATIRS